RWWYQAYDRMDTGSNSAAFTPRGAYLIRQPAAAALGIRDDLQGDQIVGTNRGDDLIESLRQSSRPATSQPRAIGKRRHRKRR
ncbi:MAG TPA: hypothetical protein VNR40_08355, partial [Steroidobacter sp.]|nr:hypothetical protein [Steroidobacter sp.]